MKKIFLLVSAFVLCMLPGVLNAAENAATTSLRTCLSEPESTTSCVLSGDVVLESDLTIPTSKIVRAQNYEIDLVGHTIVLDGGLLVKSLDKIDFTTIGSTIKYNSKPTSLLATLTSDLNVIDQSIIISGVNFDSLSEEETENVLFVGYTSIGDGYFSIEQTATGKRITLDNIYVVLVNEFIFDEEIEFIGTDEDSQITFYNNVTFLEDTKVDIRMNIEEGIFTNNGDMNAIVSIYAGKLGSIVNNGSITIGENCYFDVVGNIKNDGTITTTQTADSLFYIANQNIVGNPIVINDMELVDYSARKIFTGAVDTGHYNVYEGFLVYTAIDNIDNAYVARKENVVNLSMKLDEPNSFIELLLNDESQNALVKIEILEANNILFDDYSSGTLIYNIGDYDDYTGLEENYISKYLSFSVEDTDLPASAKLLYHFADGKTEVLNLGYIYSNSNANVMVAFESNGGSFVEPKIAVLGGVTTDPTVPTRNGYSFAGWYTEKELTNKFNFNTELNDDVVLYASWIENPKTSDMGILIYVIGLVSLTIGGLALINLKKSVDLK